MDYLLPVQIGSDWVGVVYREGECAMALMDHYDITNKAVLCDPKFEVDSMEWFKNKHQRLRIILDGELKEFQERIKDDPNQSLSTPTPAVSVKPVTDSDIEKVVELMESQMTAQGQMTTSFQVPAQFESPSLPAQAQSGSAELTTAEMDYLLFGAVPPAQNRNGYGLAQSAHSAQTPYAQNWNYHRMTGGMGQMGMNQMGWGQMGMARNGM